MKIQMNIFLGQVILHYIDLRLTAMWKGRGLNFSGTTVKMAKEHTLKFELNT